MPPKSYCHFTLIDFLQCGGGGRLSPPTGRRQDEVELLIRLYSNALLIISATVLFVIPFLLQ